MVREFSEEKRQEIFRLLDEIDNREWKSFMEWCGSSAEEFGDWTDKLAVSAYTQYVDRYHERVLETNEMTRNRVNTVFENVAEIETRYAGRMRECQVKIKEQIAMVNTMIEFMQSMTDGNPNKALLINGSLNENCIRQEAKETDNRKMCPLNRSKESRYIDTLYKTGWISEEEYQYLQYLMTTSVHVPESERIVIMGILQERISYYRNTRDVNSPGYQWIQENRSTLDLYLEEKDLEWSEVTRQHVLSEYYDTYVRDAVPLFVTAGAALVLEVEILDWERCQDLYDSISNKMFVEEIYPLKGSEESQYIDRLYRAGWISEREYQYLQYLMTTSAHVPESERVVIMGILQEKLSYYTNTRNIYSSGYKWIQDNRSTLDLYLEYKELKWPEEIKQHVLSEYYDAYVKDAAPPLLTAGAASVLEVEILDWEKCQALYDRISIKYMHIIWYGKPMQLNGSSPQEQELYRRLCNNSNYSIPWTQEKVDQLWESCEQIYDEYGIAIDPRFLLAIIIQEGTGSFNTSSGNLAADGGHGIEENYLLDLMRVNALLFGKTLGYIYYNEQFREAANNNSDKLENSTGNIFTYYNWQTPIIDLESGRVRTGVYAGDYTWGSKAEIIYELLTYEGAGKDYNRYILNLDPSVVQDIAEEIAIPNFTFSAVENGLDYKGELCDGAYTVIAE